MPFTIESCFADARFFEEGATPKDTMQPTISSTSKGVTKNGLETAKKDAPKQQHEKEESKRGNITPPIEQVAK